MSIIYFINDILCQSYQIIKSLLIIKKVMYKRDYKDKHDIILYRHYTGISRLLFNQLIKNKYCLLIINKDILMLYEIINKDKIL